MEFYPGFDIESREKDMEFVYGPVSYTHLDVYKRQALVGAILSGGFTIMSFMSFRNGKKHVLAMIDELKGF